MSGQETLEAIRGLPKRDYDGLTHVWLRRFKKSDYIEGNLPFAWFCCGSGVRAIVLFPWPNDLTISDGRNRPSNKTINEFERYGATLQKVGQKWVSKWTLEAVRKFYIQGILYHEIGHHIDRYYRLWSHANIKEVEEYADQYAIAKTANATRVYNRLAKNLDRTP